VNIETTAIVCAVRNHGEHGGVVRLLTPEHGMIAAYVRGARGRQMRPVLIPGNVVVAQLLARSESQLPQATVELCRSRAALLGEPIAAAALGWVATLLTAALPERQPYPRIYEALNGLLDAIEAAPSAIGWSAALVRFEQLLAAEIGYGDEDSKPVPPRWDSILAALERSSNGLFREVLTGRTGALQDSRSRLLDRLRRAAA